MRAARFAGLPDHERKAVFGRPVDGQLRRRLRTRRDRERDAAEPIRRGGNGEITVAVRLEGLVPGARVVDRHANAHLGTSAPAVVDVVDDREVMRSRADQRAALHARGAYSTAGLVVVVADRAIVREEL